MRKVNESLIDLLKRINKIGDTDQVYLATVKSIDGEFVDVIKEGEGSIKVNDKGGVVELITYDVRLYMDENKDSYVIPKSGSKVIVQVVDGQEYIMFVSEVDKIRIGNENENLYKILFDILGAIELLTVVTSNVPSGVPVNVADFTSIKLRLLDLFVGEN